MKPRELQADHPGACLTRRPGVGGGGGAWGLPWNQVCTLGWMWRWEAEGRGCHPKADGQGQARPK